jgi:hypothetical protein
MFFLWAVDIVCNTNWTTAKLQRKKKTAAISQAQKSDTIIIIINIKDWTL